MAYRAGQQYQPAAAKFTANRLQQRGRLLTGDIDVDQYEIEAALFQRGGGLTLALYTARYIARTLQPRTDHLAQEAIVLYYQNRASAIVLLSAHCGPRLKVVPVANIDDKCMLGGGQTRAKTGPSANDALDRGAVTV